MRVLVVDDSIIYRQYLIKIIQSIVGINDIVEARDENEALAYQKEKPADIITLDVEIPKMDGAHCIRKLLNECNKPFILMISLITAESARKTIEAMNHGAIDFITKNRNPYDQEDLNSKYTLGIKSKLTEIVLNRTKNKPYDKNKGLHFRKCNNHQKKKTDVELVLVGSSTGGPKALKDLLKPLKEDRNYAIIIIQHMPPIFTSQLARNLSKQTDLIVEEVTHRRKVKKGDILIAKGGYHLLLKRKDREWFCHLNEDPPVKSCKPSIDVAFKSVTDQIRYREAIAIILTGMGDDGLNGSIGLYNKGIPILTQDEDSCVVYGMPKAVNESEIRTITSSPPKLMNEAHKLMLKPYEY